MEKTVLRNLLLPDSWVASPENRAEEFKKPNLSLSFLESIAPIDVGTYFLVSGGVRWLCERLSLFWPRGLLLQLRKQECGAFISFFKNHSCPNDEFDQ